MALDELDYDYRQHHDREADKNLAVRFYLGPLRNEEKSAEQKRPIYDEVEFIEIRVRGDRNNIQQRPVREGDTQRFAAAYREFKLGEAQGQTGTPLKEWPSASTSMVEELKHLGFFTVEQLAQASDNVCSKFAGLTTYKNKAKAYLEHTKGLPAIDRLAEEVEQERNLRQVAENQLALMKDAMAKLEAKVEVLSSKGK